MESSRKSELRKIRDLANINRGCNILIFLFLSVVFAKAGPAWMMWGSLVSALYLIIYLVKEYPRDTAQFVGSLLILYLIGEFGLPFLLSLFAGEFSLPPPPNLFP